MTSGISNLEYRERTRKSEAKARRREEFKEKENGIVKQKRCNVADLTHPFILSQQYIPMPIYPI
jgi:hypothetical protein